MPSFRVQEPTGGLTVRMFNVICAALFAASIAVAPPVHAKNDKPHSSASLQRHPAKAKKAAWHLGWFKAKPSTPKPPRCRG